MEEILTQYSKKFENEYSKVLELIKKYNKICVFRHIIPDFDALGSQLGLYYFLKENFKDKDIKFVGDNHNKFTPSLFEETDVVEDSWFEEPFLAIICDVSKGDRISDQRFSKAKEIVVFDHHPYEKDYECISMVDTELASASELILNFIYFTKLLFPQKSAYYLYTGIVGDSGRFLYSSTNMHTFSAATLCIEQGIDINKIYTLMYEQDENYLKVMKYILTHYKVSKKGVAYYVLTEKAMKKIGLDHRNAKAYVNTFANIKNIHIWCSIAEDVSSNCFRISIRSKKITINGVANKYKGGGHAQASGCQISSLKQLKQFISDLDDLI